MLSRRVAKPNMGYNSTLVILNDALNAIESDEEFGKKVADAIRKVSCYGKPVDINSKGHCNAASVIETHHADQMKVIAVGGNYAQDLGYAGNWQSNPEAILKDLANRLGYTLRKKPGNKTEK